MPAPASQSGEGPFRKTLFRKDHKSLRADRFEHDPQTPTHLRPAPIEQAVVTIDSLGKAFLPSPELFLYSKKNRTSSVAILTGNGVHRHGQEQSEGIEGSVAIATGDLLAGVVTIPPACPLP